MPATTEQFDITYTGTSLEGNAENLVVTLTVDTATTTSGSFTGHLITAVSGTLNGQAITLLPTGSHGYDGNDNLFSPTGQHFDSNGFSFSVGGDQYNLYDNGTPPNISYGLTDHLGTAAVDTGTLTVTTPVCFVTGTRIRTTRGEVAVEHLAVGDLAVTATGQARAIQWIGHKRVEQPPRAQWPVRVMAGAFGDGLPQRDLLLSAGHALCVDAMGEVFVPVETLVNGATVARQKLEDVTYWHVELESHDVLLAEGLPAESYLNTGNRAWFGRAHGRLETVDSDRSLADACRPFVAEGPIVEAIRQRLDLRAEMLGWTRSGDMDLHLLVDGRRIEPEIDGGRARFAFPATADSVRLASRSFVPGHDARTLGISVAALAVNGCNVPLDEIAGFHPEEEVAGCAWRWTDGDLALPAELWAGRKSRITLEISFEPGAGSAWVDPQIEARQAAA